MPGREGRSSSRTVPACPLAAGFTKRSESPYDPFGAGHSSTSISAALGMAVGRDVKGRKNNVVAVRTPVAVVPKGAAWRLGRDQWQVASRALHCFLATGAYTKKVWRCRSLAMVPSLAAWRTRR